MVRQSRESALRSLVLGVLARGEAYGYEVAAQLRGITEGRDLAEESVYPILRRLERDKLASSHWVEIGVGVPRRRYYLLTPKGIAAFARQQSLRPSAPSARRLGELRP
jgi:PadR family transcriptional regulator PadR